MGDDLGSVDRSKTVAHVDTGQSTGGGGSDGQNGSENSLLSHFTLLSFFHFCLSPEITFFQELYRLISWFFKDAGKCKPLKKM